MIAPFIMTEKGVAGVAVRNFNTDAKETFSCMHYCAYALRASSYLLASTSIRCVHQAIGLG